MMNSFSRQAIPWLLAGAFFLFVSMANAQPGAVEFADYDAPAVNEADPYENWNRKVFVFNEFFIMHIF